MGLLDSLSDPTVSAGLLGMGAGLLSGSTGHYGAFAPALGQGFAGMQASQNNERQLQQQGLLRGLQAAQLKLALQKQGLINSAWGNTLGIPTTPATPASGLSAPTVPSAPSSGAVVPLSSAPQSSVQTFPIGPSGAPQQGPVRTPTQPSVGPSISPSTQPPASQPGGFKMPIIPGMSAEDSFFAFTMLGPAEYMKMAMGQTGTDLQKTLAAAGIKPGTPEYRQAMQEAIKKANYIAPTNIRPGGFTQEADGTVQQFPQVPEGYTAQRDQNGQWRIVPVQGALDATQASAAAKAQGQAAGKLAPTQYDAQGHPLPTTSVAEVLNNNTPMGLRNNNPGNLRPQGRFAQYPDMQTGLKALDDTLVSYGKQGINTLTGIITKWAPPSDNNDTQAYIADASKRLGLDPNQKIDLSKPLVRQVVSTAIALHENGPRAVFASSSPTSFSAPPLGSVAKADAAAAITGKRQGLEQAGLVKAADVARYEPMVKKYETTVIPGESTAASVDRALGYIDRTISAIDKGALNNVTGPRGQYIPDWAMGQTAANALADLESVKSKVVLNTMNEMRQASAAGATGFGNMQQNELKVIEDSLGSIQRAQSAGQIKSNLLIIRDAFRGIRNSAGAQIDAAKKLYKGIPGIPDEDNLRGVGQEQTATKASTLQGPDAPASQFKLLNGSTSNSSGFKIIGVR